MIVDFRRNPPALPSLTIMNSTVTAVESFRFLGTTISQDLKWDTHIDSIVKKGPAEVVLPSPAEKVQPATGAAETVLLRHHWIHPLHFNNCLVQLSYQIWPQKSSEGSPDCWANHWYNPPQELHLSRVSKMAGKITLDPSHPAHSLFELLPSDRCYRALSPRMTRHRNSFFPQAIHLMNTWHYTWNTQHYYTLFIHHTYLFFISNLHNQTWTHIIVYIIYCVFAILYIAYLPICLLLFYYLCPVLLLSFCCTVELLSL